jgi:hypothetical protein
MSQEFEEQANHVRQTLIELAERSPVVVATADISGLAVWQLVALWCDHLPGTTWRDIVSNWSVDMMHDVLATFIVWAENQQGDVEEIFLN